MFSDATLKSLLYFTPNPWLSAVIKGKITSSSQTVKFADNS